MYNEIGPHFLEHPNHLMNFVISDMSWEMQCINICKYIFRNVANRHTRNP